MRYGNCWLYALPRWLRGEQKYLIVRKSMYTFWPHVMLTNDISQVYVEEYQPVDPAMGWRAKLAAIVFRGRVRKGKGEE